MENEKHVKSVRPIEVHLTSETVGQSPRLYEQREQEITDADDDGRPELVEQQHEEAGLGAKGTDKTITESFRPRAMKSESGFFAIDLWCVGFQTVRNTI